MASFKVEANKKSKDVSSGQTADNERLDESTNKAPAQTKKEERNEIKEYLHARYIGPMEAANTILGFEVHNRFPAVIRLCVHKSHEQLVYFNEQNASAKARAPRDSTLTAFFKLCRTDEFARRLVYTEVPSYFVWHHSEREWRRAKLGSRVEDHPGIVHNTNIARMYTVSPRAGDLFYVRMLLLHVRGPTSFEALHTVDGVLHPSAKAACMALGLLQRDDHWRRCLAEAVQSRMPRAVRHLLAVILIWGNPDDGSDLWCSFAEDLCEDLRFHNRDLSAEEITDLALRELQSMLTSMGGISLPEYGLPAASVLPQVGPMQFDTVEQAEMTEARLPMLTEEQRTVFESVTADLVAGSGGLHFLDAPAGTGKTFLLEVLLAFVRSRSEVALAVAASGIAATLLQGGQTAHSTFKIPVRLLRSNKDVCAVGAQSKQADVFRRVRLIVWDEISMTNRKDLESVDRCLRDVRKQDKPFGGVTLVCAGDFRQLLPVVMNGTRANNVMACVCRSSLWKLFKRHRLTRNIRLLSNSEPAMYLKFMELLMQIGSGTIEQDAEEKVSLPAEMVISAEAPLTELIKFVYPSFEASAERDDYFANRAILAPYNDSVDAINEECLAIFPGSLREYRSVDSLADEEAATHFPTELLNQLDAPNFPTHLLKIKVGMPLVLLRNIHPPRLCNGTRLIVLVMGENVLRCKIAAGQYTGDEILLPRIPLVPNNADLPVNFKRLQFPVKPSFCLTIHKSQGQSLETVGVDLAVGCFTHGQLYTALSRAKNAANVRVRICGTKTRNVVFPEVLTAD